jgi:LmbE family N-acetylglucosaminyl deacetylase
VLDLVPRRHDSGRLSVLAIGAHSDDIEIGCGASILALADSETELDVTWVVLSARGDRAAEARESAAAYLEGVSHAVRLGDFRDGFFPYDPGVKDFYETLKRDTEPDVILVHGRDDLHQDHRVACELAWNTFRDHLILEYEIPKYDGDLGRPNVFVPIHERHARRKAELLVAHFASQRDKHWFTEDVFLGLMRLRGVEARSPTGYAEAFVGRKLRVGLAVTAA